MSARGVAAGVVTSAVVLVLGWQVGQAHVASTGTVATGAVDPGRRRERLRLGGRACALVFLFALRDLDARCLRGFGLVHGLGPSTGTTSTAADGTYTGSPSQTPYGTVQVAVTVRAEPSPM